MGRLLQPITYPDTSTNISYVVDVNGESYSGICVWDYSSWGNSISQGNCYGSVVIYDKRCGCVYISVDLQCDLPGGGISTGQWTTEKNACDGIPSQCGTIDGEYILRNIAFTGDLPDTINATISTGGGWALADMMDAKIARSGGCRSCGLHA